VFQPVTTLMTSVFILTKTIPDGSRHTVYFRKRTGDSVGITTMIDGMPTSAYNIFAFGATHDIRVCVNGTHPVETARAYWRELIKAGFNRF
jgi:hypothetical protein